jgi:cytochrome c
MIISPVPRNSVFINSSLAFLFTMAMAMVLASSSGLWAQPVCPDPVAADFKKEALTPKGMLKEPIEMTIAKDGRVFIAERHGRVLMYDPATTLTTVAAELNTYIFDGQFDVGGILGVAVTPEFPTDPWVYVYYAPKALFNGIANDKDGKFVQRLARFKFIGGKLDLPTEQTILEIPAEWQTHNGGSLIFGKGGNLFLSTGDNSCAGCNDQFSPMDERPGHISSDDQRSTANTNDLRGKIIRIHPEPALVNGKYYSIPKGNLFAEGQAKTRPEVYTMGHRNPYRIFPDPITNRLFIGEFGPAAQAAKERGPAGADQIKITDSAANLGYPYFLKDNQPYCHWDYELTKCVPIKGQAEMVYNPARPTNTSPNNTGLEILPPAKPAMLWEHDGPSVDPVSGVKGCGWGAGPVYHFDPSSSSKVKFPPFFDSKWMFYGIGAGYQPKLVAIPPGPQQPITKAMASPFTSGAITFSGNLHDIEYGPHDGALYLVDYGAGFYADNGDAGLYRVTYGGCNPPVTVKPSRRFVAQRSRTIITQSLAGTSLKIPEGARILQVFDLKGKAVWETSLLGVSSAYVSLPSTLGSGLLQVMWR